MKGSSQKVPDNIINKLKFKKIFPSIKMGDCLIHHPDVIHGSLKNNSNIDRIGLAVSFVSKNAIIDKVKQNIYKGNLKKNLKKVYS